MTPAIPTSAFGARRVPGDLELRQRDEKLESLKAVVGKLAHDFNNFLAPQYGYITLLKDEVAAGSTQATYVNAMESSALKTEGYISAILVGMRPHRNFSPREFELNCLLQDCLDRWSAASPADTQVEVISDLEPAPFIGDEKQWRIAFEHLLSNARYALAMGGKLFATLRRETLPGPEVERLGLGTDHIFCLKLRDSGFGMSPEVLRRAFEPFFTTRTGIKAAGLGLTIVHGITLFHGGQVELSSVEDQGSTVTLWLPASRSGSADRYENLLSSKTPVARRKALLLADDPLIKEVLRNWLNKCDLEVETAASEKDLRRSLQRAGENAALIVCESDLKIGRAEDLHSSISDVQTPARWVFLAGKRMPEVNRTNGREDPLVMKKPFSHAAFAEVVRKYSSR
jgi:nitrogen-specific signal transduction histidine kinase